MSRRATSTPAGAPRGTAEIDRLGSEMSRMIELHARREGRSERKVALLMEIKSAMEKQIRFLKGGWEDEDDVSVR